MLVLGDAHADDPDNRAALEAAYAAAADEAVALQTGDLLFYRLPLPTWFIAGNNENLDVIDRLRSGEVPPGTDNAHLLASTTVEIDGRRVAGLSGNYAPTQYDKPRSALSDDRRRHFTFEDVERAAGLGGVEVLLTHEAPHGLLTKPGYDPGCAHVDTLLRTLTPELCLVGHHHEHVESTFGETRVVGLSPVWEAYYTLDHGTLELERHATPA